MKQLISTLDINYLIYINKFQFFNFSLLPKIILKKNIKISIFSLILLNSKIMKKLFFNFDTLISKILSQNFNI